MSNRTKLILILLIVLVAYIIARRLDLFTKIRRLFIKKYINYDCIPNESGRVSDDRKQFLESVASKIYSDIYNTPYTGHDCTLYESAYDLCDEELQYVAQHYRKALSRGSSIVQDLGEEFTLVCDFDIFIARLQKIGEI